MRKATATKALYVQEILGPGYEVLEFEESTRTSEDAAAAIGCTVPRIAKSLIFKAADETPVLIVASGSNRVDEKKIKALLGQKIKRADADWAREMTGFAIGGIGPVGHRTAPTTFIDQDLMQYDTVWASAGTPNAVFELKPAELETLTGGSVADVAKP